ncbi:MAG: hypothetical protein J6Y94_02760, partial [Bacteriovoracaceae bacterium]|nr:hypothetical protein [Bacteriovoracaceae bacterium]
MLHRLAAKFLYNNLMMRPAIIRWGWQRYDRHWPKINISALGVLLGLLWMAAGPSMAQDEKFLQELRQGKFNPIINNQNASYSFVLESMMYDIDLNQDGGQEGIMFQQRDGESWMVIYSSQGRKLGEFKF